MMIGIANLPNLQLVAPEVLQVDFEDRYCLSFQLVYRWFHVCLQTGRGFKKPQTSAEFHEAETEEDV